MSKKKLLEEAQVRRMFALAGNPALGESFISNRFSKFNEEEEDEMADPASFGGMALLHCPIFPWTLGSHHLGAPVELDPVTPSVDSL